jgi:hypothetical protein
MPPKANKQGAAPPQSKVKASGSGKAVAQKKDSSGDARTQNSAVINDGSDEESWSDCFVMPKRKKPKTTSDKLPCIPYIYHVH